MIPPNPDAPRRPVLRVLKRLAAWIVLALLFYLLFRLVPPEAVLDEFHRLPAPTLYRLMALSVVFIVGVSVLDGTAMWYGFSLFKVPLKWSEIVLLRTAMMLVASIATLFGQAGLAAHLARKHNLPAGKAAGMVLFLFLVEVYGMLTVSTLALPVLLITGAPAGAPFYAVLAILAAAWAGLGVLFLAARALDPNGIIKTLRLAGALDPLRTIRLPEFLRLLGYKTLLAAWQIGLTHVAFKIYGIDVPPAELFALMPPAIIISSIPITPGRLGTTQFSWKFFFEYRLAASVLVAFSLLLQFLLNVARWAVGALALPLVWRDLFPREDQDRARA